MASNPKSWSTHTSPRGLFALLIPTINTTVEAEFNWMRAPHTSWHTARFRLPDATTVSAQNHNNVPDSYLQDLKREIRYAIDSVMACKPTYLVVGMFLETLWNQRQQDGGGVQGFEDWITDVSGGIRIITPAAAIRAALNVYGARRIGVVTAYRPEEETEIISILTSMNYEIKAIRGFACTDAASIANVTPAQIKTAFTEVDGPEVDALLQVRTNLVAAIPAAEMEVQLEKPVIAMNTAIVWHAYRSCGIDDRILGYGKLLEEH